MTRDIKLHRLWQYLCLPFSYALLRTRSLRLFFIAISFSIIWITFLRNLVCNEMHDKYFCSLILTKKKCNGLYLRSFHKINLP
jgi:hypothetical protein